MSATGKVKPFTAEERVILGRHCDVYEAYGPTEPVTKAYLIKKLRRYEATLRQLEAGLAAVTAERDAYRGVVDILCSYGTRDTAVLSYRALAVEARNSDAANKWRVVAHYEALAKALEEMPELDLIAAEVIP